MEPDDAHLLTNPVKCCDCDCNCSLLDRSPSGTYIRSVKRKHDEFEEDSQFIVPGLIIPQNARVGIKHECMVLRQTLNSQQEALQDLICELEQERNASASAAKEAMSMILRLQREKAEIEMNANQFKRYADEKMAHDHQEMLELEELLYKRKHTIEALTCEVQAYKHRMISYGLGEEEIEAEVDEFYMCKEESPDDTMTENLEEKPVLPDYRIYPPLKCNVNESYLYPDGDDKTDDVEKHALGETPYSQNQLMDLEYRINQLERSPKSIQPDRELASADNVFEKLIVGQSPSQPRHLRGFSSGSLNSPFEKREYSHWDVSSTLKKVDNASEGGDDLSDRVYTIDSINRGVSVNVGMDQNRSTLNDGHDYVATKALEHHHSNVKDLEIQKLYARLHALEADRETMKHAIISVGIDKAQMILLKEIAQNLCNKKSPSRKISVQEKSKTRRFSFISIFKWIISFLFGRRKARKCRYMFGQSTNNIGLRMFLDRGRHAATWRIVSNKIL